LLEKKNNPKRKRFSVMTKKRWPVGRKRGDLVGRTQKKHERKNGDGGNETGRSGSGLFWGERWQSRWGIAEELTNPKSGERGGEKPLATTQMFGRDGRSYWEEVGRP